MRARMVLLALQLLVAVVGLALWQFLATVPVFGKVLLPPFFFSNPFDVFSQVVKWFSSGVIWKHLFITLWESILAFVIGSLSGAVVGFWFARQPTVAASQMALPPMPQPASSTRSAGPTPAAVARTRFILRTASSWRRCLASAKPQCRPRCRSAPHSRQ